MYHSFLIHSFADGHLGCCQHLAMINCAAMNMGVHRIHGQSQNGEAWRVVGGGKWSGGKLWCENGDNYI